VPHPLFTKPAKLHEIAGAFGTPKDMHILRVFEIKLLRFFNKGHEHRAIETSDAVRVRIVFEHVLLESFKQESVVFIIPHDVVKLAHEILSGALIFYKGFSSGSTLNA
jgi:hypothetical protein